MKPNTQTLAITTGAIFRSLGPIRHHHLPINIVVQRCTELLGFKKCVQPNLRVCQFMSSLHSARPGAARGCGFQPQWHSPVAIPSSIQLAAALVRLPM
jgi:hypothetical protein